MCPIRGQGICSLINNNFTGSSDYIVVNLHTGFIVNGSQMPWIFENNENNTNNILKHILCAKHSSKCFQSLQFIFSLQPPSVVGSIINSFTDEEFEVKRCLLILIRIMKLRGEFESKPRIFTHLNTTKLHWGLLWWFSSKEI